MEAFKKRFQKFIETESLTGDQILNCDESGLNYKILPSKSLAARTEMAATGYNHSTERLTILACSNATANLKMDLAMIGKSKNPRPLKTVSRNAPPLKYYNQKNLWMSSGVFKDWFFKEFIPLTEKFLEENNQPRKANLLLDNAPTHPHAEELSKLCHQGNVSAPQCNRHTKLLSTIIEEIEGSHDMTEKLKCINVKDVGHWVTRARADCNVSLDVRMNLCKKLSLLPIAMTTKLKIKIKHELFSLSEFHIMTELRL
ncbi:hypothetical protein PR048_029509 [Dryococelus australis]|uniref:DDE-1 domain-containing protein n=1 Tax=Dryococelus australis TaxID=614101 RepID=A0ABQ9GDM9_9NEOP|nr:hypothetical protein PR048_029509 [Dryococelus australis]